MLAPIVFEKLSTIGDLIYPAGHVVALVRLAVVEQMVLQFVPAQQNRLKHVWLEEAIIVGVPGAVPTSAHSCKIFVVVL